MNQFGSNSGKPLPGRTMSRRVLLRGLGGVTLALPFLEGLAPKRASAAPSDVEPFAIFFRQANGVACAQENEELGVEPERFWPKTLGALDATNVEGRALDELSSYLSRLLVVQNVNMCDYEYGDGHARGALQVLTASGPVDKNAGGESEANGESLDHRIGRQLNPNGGDSLFLYAGQPYGWLGGPCVSYRGPNDRRAAISDPSLAYQQMIGGTDGLSQEAIDRLVTRNQSVNDLVRGQLSALLKRPELSSSDRKRLDLHLTSIRDLESNLSCRKEVFLPADLGDLESIDGDQVLATARHHMEVAALAVACGFTRSVAIQVGSGNDGSTRFRDPDSGEMMENYHYISHRRLSHDASGGVIANGDVLHNKIDRQFGQTFRHLLDKLSEYDLGGETLLDRGVAIWHNDLGNGPGHGSRSIPWIMAGSASGYFKQGQFIKLDDDQNYWELVNHARVLNAIGSAVGCTSEGKEELDDFGAELDKDGNAMNRSPHPALRA